MSEELANDRRSPPEELENDERWLTVQRIASSHYFQRSERLREFLFYVAKQKLLGHPEEITEPNIGRRVYRRGERYSPVEDNIVRVSARQLRTKLQEFYEAEGKDEPWVIEIPKGGYVPQFHEKDAPQATAKETEIADSELKTPRSGKANINHRYFILLALVLVIVLLIWMKQPRATRPMPERDLHGNLVTSIFEGSVDPMQIVLSDSALVLMESTLGRRVSLPEYESRKYRTPPDGLTTDGRDFETWKILASRQIVNLGDVNAAVRIVNGLRATSHQSTVTIRSAQQMNTRDFRSGDFIIFGNSYSDPWTQLFENERFNFHFENDSRDAPYIANRHPKPHELAAYTEQLNQGYAVIALVPNLTDSGMVLLIAGLSMESTESAADFCMDPTSMPILAHALGVQSTAKLPYFEALLGTSKDYGTGVGAQLLDIRLLRDK